MNKSELLKALLTIRDIGCCNMLDKKCVVKELKLLYPGELANHIEGLTGKEYYSLLSKDFTDYLLSK